MSSFVIPPMVLIAGRPNVGKSSLFNRIAGRRVSIVHPESGVTRDRIMHETTYKDKRFIIVDSGGLPNVDNQATSDEINQGIRDQLDTAIEEAVAIILVADARHGIHPMDSETARILRKTSKPVIVAANKVDPGMSPPPPDAFASLGFPVFNISATHGSGVSDILDAVIDFVPKMRSEDDTEVSTTRVAIVGKPNVGKSSLINAMIKSKRLLVSNVPGTTRDSIEIPFTFTGSSTRYVLIDTAGLRLQRKIDSAPETFGRMRAEHSIRSCDVAALVIDAAQGPTAFDRRICAMINQAMKGCIFVVNKWDLAKNLTQEEYRTAFFDFIPFMRHCPIIFLSAKESQNLSRAAKALEQVARNTKKRFPTSVLNKIIESSLERYHPPAIGGRILKVFYATQTDVAPLTILLFVNSPSLVSGQFKSFLSDKLRKQLHLPGVPILIKARSRRE